MFLGVGSELGGGTTSGAAIEVNGRPISAREFLEQESRLQEYYSQFFKDFKPAEKKLFYGTLKRQAAQQLIENEITYQIAKEQNIYAAPEEIRDRLLSFKALYKDGRFSHELYNNFLRNRNMSASYFEKQLEKALVILKLRKIDGERGIWFSSSGSQSGVVRIPSNSNRLRSIEAGNFEKTIKNKLQGVKRFQ